MTSDPKHWINPALAELLDYDVVEAANEAHLMTNEAIQLQLCCEIHRLSDMIADHFPIKY